MGRTAGCRHALLAGTALATGLIVVGAAPARAQTVWQGNTSADWFVGTNWSTGTVPGAADNVIVNQGSPNANPTIGINGTSNAATSLTASIGDTAGTTGAVTVSTTNAGVPASWTLSGAGGFNGNLVTGPLMVGNNGTGSLTITNGGAVTTNGNLGNVVIGSVGSGTVTVGSATAPNLASPSTLTNSGPLFGGGGLIVGDTGTGTLIINQDGVVSGFQNGFIGHGAGGQGTVIVNGGSLNVIHNIAGELDVGLSSLGALTVKNGGTVTSLSGFVGQLAGSSGSGATVTGANSTWNVTGGSSLGGFGVGNGGSGSLSILAGGSVNAVGSPVNIGAGPNSTSVGTGTVLVDNGQLIANGGIISVGVAGTGGSTMTVQNGGQVSSDGGAIGGFSPSSSNGNNAATGTVTVTGAGSLWNAALDVGGANDAASQLFVDNPANMTGLVIQQGGQVISGSGFVSDFSNGFTNTVVVDGAGSKWTNLTSLNVGYSQPGFGAVASNGIVNITNGGQVSAPTVSIGVLPDGGGSAVDAISVSGAGSALQAPTTLAVGLFGTGNLMVSAGATVTSGAGIIGFSSATPGSLMQSGVGALDTSNVGANSVGTVLVTGTGSTWTTNSLIVGDNATTDPSGTFTGIGGGTATGTLTVASGGAVNSTGNIQVALNAGSTGTINIGAADGQPAAAPGTISAPAIVFGAGTGTLVFNHTSANYVFGVQIQGPGSVIVDSGSTALTAANSYSGGTAINGGTVVVGNNTALGSGLVTMAAGTTLSFLSTGNFTVANNFHISGDPFFTPPTGTTQTLSGIIADGGTPGVLNVTGGGTLVLSGANTYSGGTNINASTLQLSGAGTLGANTGITTITGGTLDLGGTTQTQAALHLNGGTLQNGALNAPITSTGGAINGIGGTASLTTTAGTTILSGIDAYSGATTVNGGTLEVDGTITGTSSVTVNAGGTLTGNGTIDPLIVAINNGATFAPGNSTPGNSIAIVGNLAFQSGAIYMVALNPATSSFASVSGTATLSGATVNAVFANGSYVEKKYTILTAAGGVNGTFGSLVNTNLPAGITDSLSYDANDVFLGLSAVLGSAGGLNQNQQNVANSINNFFNGGGALPPAFLALFGLTGSNLAAGLTQVSGETATGSQQTTFDAMNLFLGLITDPFVAGRGDGVSAGGGATNGYADEQSGYAAKRKPDGALASIYTKAPPPVTFEQRWSVWAAGFGGSQTTDGNAVTGSNTATSRIAATAVGADYRFSPDTLAGIAMAGGGTSFSVANGGTGHSDLFQAGAFFRHNAGAAYVTAALAYGWQDVTTDRTVTIAGVDRLQARFNANSYSGRIESGYRFIAPWAGGIGITPYAAGQFTTFELPAYAEGVLSGANTFALAYGAKSVTDPRSELGIRTDKSWAMMDGILTLRGRLAWAHDYDTDRSIGATFQTLPGASFVVNGAMQARDSALTTASAEMKWINGWSAAATFEGEFSNVTASYAGKGVVRYNW
jgi:T5SS/PEP-CTERM-associated repeat protein/autotransporter-associated beta strand protein